MAASSRVLALGERQLRAAVAALAARLPAPTPGSQVAFAFDRDRAAFAVALLAVWQRGHAVALPASARRRHVGPVMPEPRTVALVHDTGAGTGIDVARLLADCDGAPPPSGGLAVSGALRTFAPDGSAHEVARGDLDDRIRRALDELGLRPDTRVANRCALHSAAALVPGLLAPLAAGAHVTDETDGAHVLVAPAADVANGTSAARTVAIEDPPEVSPAHPPRRPLAFAAVPGTNGASVHFRTTVPRDFFGFAGHFPGYPVLSGAVQLHELVLPCLAVANAATRVAAFSDLKFLARIAPGDTVDVTLRHDPARGSCDFEIVRGGVRCSSGRALLRTADAEQTP